MRRMKKDCDENGSPYPTMKSGNGEFRITFSARTKESVAKLGMPPEKFGIADDTEDVSKNSEEVAKTSDAAARGAGFRRALGRQRAKSKKAYDNLMNN